MAQVRWFCTVLMIHSLVGLPSAGAVAYNKSVCNGDSIQLFDGIQINDSDSFANIYKNGDNPTKLGRLTISNHTFYENKNLIIDDNKNIWIINVHRVDKGLYYIKYNMANGSLLETIVQLSVWVAPNNNCSILMTKQGQVLTVALTGKDKDDCGYPKASVYWKNYTGVTVHDEKVLQLQSGNEAGTYYACMRGIALSCTKSSDTSADHCRPYDVNKGQSQSSTVGSTSQLSSECSKDSILTVIVVLQCTVPVISFGIYILYKKNPCGCKRKLPNTGHQGEKGDVPNADQKPEEIPLNQREEQV